MVDESVEFETWEEFNEYINSASSSQLHSLAIKHADCWAQLLVFAKKIKCSGRNLEIGEN